MTEKKSVTRVTPAEALARAFTIEKKKEKP